MIYNVNMKEFRNPSFNKKTGYLKPGIYCMTIDELRNHEILGGTLERKNLIKSLEIACKFYWNYGITEIYANGSFATMKPIPNDIDGYLYVNETDNGLLQVINSDSVWGKFYGFHSAKDKYQMWYEYKVEFYLELKGQEFFTDFFTHSRDGIERGIIKVIQGGQL